ncbi:hypothetical protein SAMN02745126_05868 [Enhydrobacter aerosaccus]|uniref:Anti-sigma factor NepR domain-containing protein n=1 Tax=Enhydrobacter aerosaccus TaxID=225324 RepID=A0A1T4T912_9HYPH|nr:NepR family anti-sigma factor [Enhydrobacter aerosaccus]SKA37004.1 hypothetical protein SAMN02745126_05868 [Enhydrobacter aerosaccus]
MGILAEKPTCLGQEPVGWAPFRGTKNMANDDKPLKERAREGAHGEPKSASERPFDLWLQKQLHAMYDEIASEPLPDDLLRLIEHDAARKGPDPSGKK